MGQYLSIGQAAAMLGVSIKTLRRWEKAKKFIPKFRTTGGHRLYKRGDIISFINHTYRSNHIHAENLRAAIYVRVSSSRQKTSGDLSRQIETLTQYCAEKKYQIVKIYEDVGSGLNDARKGLMKMLEDASKGLFEVLMVNYNDRLARFGIRVIEKFLSTWDIAIEIKNPVIIDSHDPRNINFPKSEYISGDWNRIGKYSVALATLEHEINMSNSPILQNHEQQYKKLEIYRKKVIPAIQKKIKRNTATGKSKAERRLVYRKLHNIITTTHREANMLYLYVGSKVKASYFGWDGVNGISTRNTPGTLAMAITYLPKKKDRYDEFTEWAKDLRDAGPLSNYKKTVVVDSRTSQICSECLATKGIISKNKPNPKDYHTYKCKKPECGYYTHTTNRHTNAARVSAYWVKQKIEKLPLKT